MKIYGKYLLLAAMAGASTAAFAQDSYDAETFSSSDLNGTARFVAMGGALGALGGDLSVMSTNPAGTAMYRRGDVSFTASGLFGNKGQLGFDSSKMSLDQGGVVFTFEENGTSKGLQFINFGINYQKKKNFFANIGTEVENLNGNLSQTFQIADLANDNVYYGSDPWGTLADLSAESKKHDGILYHFDTDEDGELDKYFGVGAKSADYKSHTYGATTQADVNLSFNVSNQFFYGLSLGVYDLERNRESRYSEVGMDGYGYQINSWYKTSGDGFDVKLGFICRPIEESSFRFGVTVHTPTFYNMTDANGATIYYPTNSSYSLDNGNYDYKFRTPWKFGVNLGHTVGDNLAIGAEWEYQDLSTTHYSDIDGYSNEYFESVNEYTKETLKGQHTFKVGLEYKPIDDFSLRAGYNLVTSPFKDKAFRTLTFDGPYTETAFTNWGATNRFTFGLGYKFKGGYFDVAYQYQMVKGDFYAFDNYAEDITGNAISEYSLSPTKINNNRSQLMATIGFRF